MLLEQRSEVHLVDVIAGEHERVSRSLREDEVEILTDGVGRTSVPPRMQPLLSGPDVDEFTQVSRQRIPAARDVPDERLCLVLGQHADPADLRVDAVREREVDVAEVAGEGQRGFALIPGEPLKPGPVASCQHYGERIERLGLPGHAGWLLCYAD